VDCSGCPAPCCYLLVPLTLSDNPQEYLTDVHPQPGLPPLHTLQRRADGGCIYLGEHGCTIYDRAPKACRKFDCTVAPGVWPDGVPTGKYDQKK
jgi:Fe-S-cluster containining protein